MSEIHEIIARANASSPLNTALVAQEAYLEIKGREGTMSTLRKRVRRLSEITDAEKQKLCGIAQRLPVVAFDAYCDPLTIELRVNPDGKVWHDKLGEEGKECICYMSESDADELIRKVAGYMKVVITRERPFLECVFPLDGSRFAAQIPPIVPHPAFAIRKHAVRVFTLDDYVLGGVMSPMQSDYIRQAVRDRQNILVIGGTGSGKTTLGNAVLHEITVSDPGCRQIIIEDTAELNSTARDKVNYQTSEFCTTTDLIKISLRMTPDRVIVGEVRGPEAFDLIQVWYTGHPGGISTLHANDCASGLRRLKSLISQHPYAPRDIEPDIALAVNVMVNIVKSGTERRIKEIVAIREYDPTLRKNNGYLLEAMAAA